MVLPRVGRLAVKTDFPLRLVEITEGLAFRLMVFQYTTSSTSLQKKLGVAPERPATTERAATPERVAP